MSRAVAIRAEAMRTGSPLDDKVLYYLRGALQRCIGRLFFNGLLETATQVNLQMTVWAIFQADLRVRGLNQDSDMATIQFASSIILSLFTAVERIYCTMEFLSFSHMVLPWFPEESRLHNDAVANAYDKCWRMTVMAYVLFVVYVMAIAWAFAKLIALQGCEYALWMLSQAALI